MDHGTAIRRLHLHAVHAEDDEPALAGVLHDLLVGLAPDDRRAVLRHAWWRMPEVPTGALLAAAPDVRTTAGPGPVVGRCPACARAVRARRREDADPDAGADADAPSRPCPRCRAVRPAPARRRPGHRGPHPTRPAA